MLCQNLSIIRIDEHRFLSNLAKQTELGKISPADERDLERRSFSIEKRNVRTFFSKQAELASLEVKTDEAANLSARLSCGDPDAPTLLMGSHLDSVPNRSSYDGALGVWGALEVLCTLSENNIKLPINLEAIAFTGGEGTMGSLFGSKALVGKHSSGSINIFLSQASRFSEDLQAMQEIVPGRLTTEAVISAKRSIESIAGFLELHIEQGPQLEQKNICIGSVDSVYGRRSLFIRFLGRSAHAGTTPLHLRADTLVAASQFISKIPPLFQDLFPNCTVTCGNIIVKHGAFNVVPAETTVWIEYRSALEESLLEIEKEIIKLADRVTFSPGLSFSIETNEQEEPVTMDMSVQEIVYKSCKELNYSCMTLSSATLPDAISLATVVPTGLIFVPSKVGRSHSLAQDDTDSQDLVAGANVLLHTALHFLKQYHGRSV